MALRRRFTRCGMARGGGNKKRYQYCSDISRTIVYLRALQGHSGRSLIDPSLQDNVIIQCGLFHHIYHVGCAFNLHSIINNGSIPGGQDSSMRQTVFFLPIDPRDKVNSIHPNTENSLQYGYDENDNNNMSNETKHETNYSMNNKWNDVNTHNYMQLTMHNKYTNDDVAFDACVVHIMR